MSALPRPWETEPKPWTRQQLADRTLQRRAIEAALWGIGLVNFDAMRQAYFRDARAKFNDIIYWSRPSDWKNQIATPNSSTSYVIFFVNLKDGPVVVEIPPAEETALYGTLIDSWNTPMLDVGNEGADKGKGGKYLLLPPGHEGKTVAGYISVLSATYNAYSLLRLITKTNSVEDRTNAMAYLRRLKVYPLSNAAAPPSPRYIDLARKVFSAIPAYDPSFYDSLARMVGEEPVQEKDLAIMGQLRSLGVGKDLTFKPDARTTALLDSAIAEAHALMEEQFFQSGFPWWPDRKWRYLVDEITIKTRVRFIVPGQYVAIDERAATWFSAFGAIADPKTANLYLKVQVDAKDERLDGAHTYRLRVPANVPADQFWSVNVYDASTAGFIREAPVVGLDSYNQEVQENSDGSTDFYFSPTPPQGHERNWVSTASGRGFFLLFRFYGPQRSVMERKPSWMLDDLERIDTPMRSHFAEEALKRSSH